MNAKLAAELAAAEAELKAARAELADLEAGKKPKRSGRPKSPRRADRRPMHHPESGLRSEIAGYGGPAIVGTRIRTDMQPIVMKHVSPFDRPVSSRMQRKVSVMVFDAKAVWQPLLSNVMTEREADALAAELPWGWTLTSRPAK